MNKWLPKGYHNHLHIEHRSTPATGPFTDGKPKLLWHITVSPWERVDSMADLLIRNGDEPHFVIGGRQGVINPVVIQLLPLDQFGKSLEHPAGTPETNRANVIQVEICAGDITQRGKPGYKDSDIVDFWPMARYRALANLAYMIDRRHPIPAQMARRFVNTERLTPSGFINATGHLGHMHAPSQRTAHSDPTTAFKGSILMKYIKSAPNDL
jgi:hypothetical protein